jgi:hypothetical protein
MSNTRPSKEIQQRRSEARRSGKRRKHSTTHFDWKFWTGTALGLLGLFVAIPALWLAIEDRPTVSLGSQPDPRNPLSTQVILTNNGALPISNVVFDSFIKRALTDNSDVAYLIERNYELPTGILRPGEPKITKMAAFFPSRNYRELDAALIANFTPEWAPFWHRMRIFRFTFVPHADGTAQLQQIPAEGIEDEYRNELRVANHK